MAKTRAGWVWYRGKFRPFLKYERKKKTVKVLLGGKMRTVKEEKIKAYPEEGDNGNTARG